MPLVCLPQDVLAHSAAGERSKVDEEFAAVGGAHDGFWSQIAVGVRRATRDEYVVAGAGDDHRLTEAHPVLACDNNERLLVPGVDMITNPGLSGRVVSFDDPVARVAFWLVIELQPAAPRRPEPQAVACRTTTGFRVTSVPTRRIVLSRSQPSSPPSGANQA